MAAYALFILVLLPATMFAHMLGGGLVYFAGTAAAAFVLGRYRTAPISILLVSFIGAAILVMPNFPAMGGKSVVAVPIGFLGSQAGALLWVSLRWRPDRTAKTRSTLAQSWMVGLFGVGALCIIATLPIGFALLSGKPDAVRMLWVYPAYVAGGLSAASFYWLLQGIAQRPVGRYLIGVLGGFCMYAAMGPVVALARGEPISTGEIAMIGLVAGCLVGPPVAMSWNDTFSA